MLLLIIEKSLDFVNFEDEVYLDFLDPYVMADFERVQKSFLCLYESVGELKVSSPFLLSFSYVSMIFIYPFLVGDASML